MSWKCVCKEENNPDESNKCKNCGRAKPKYLNVKLDVNISEKMTKEQKAVWYLMIAHDYLQEADEYLSLNKDLQNKLGDPNYDQFKVGQRITNYEKKIESNCINCLNTLEKVNNLNPDAQFIDNKEFVQNISSVKSACYFNLGSLYFEKQNWEKAISNFQKSYDSDPNQVSIYNIAMATINIPIETTGMFSGKKRETEKMVKREQVIELLKKTIKFAPFSVIGRKSGKMLLSDYKIDEIDL